MEKIKLSDYQKEVILNNFFKNEEYPGWKNIATTLIDNGKCIVAGEKCIWFGGIGNFIKTTEAEGLYNCLLYTFDIEEFFKSKWFVSFIKDFTEQSRKEKTKMEHRYQDSLSLKIHAIGIKLV